MLDYTEMSLQQLQEHYDLLDEDSQMSDAHNTWENNRREMSKIKQEMRSRYANV